jgi:hypothetical protein
VILLPGVDVVTPQQEVGIRGGLRREVEHRRWVDQPARLQLEDIGEVPAGQPVHRCVEVGPGVLGKPDVVPVEVRARRVVPADYLALEPPRPAELGGRSMTGVSSHRAS